MSVYCLMQGNSNYTSQTFNQAVTNGCTKAARIVYAGLDDAKETWRGKKVLASINLLY